MKIVKKHETFRKKVGKGKKEVTRITKRIKQIHSKTKKLEAIDAK